MTRDPFPYMRWAKAGPAWSDTNLGMSGVAPPSAAERQAVIDADSILAFDDRFVAPRNGYPNAAAYYADNMARRFLSQIALPTLVIHARDDPWIPADMYTSYRWSDNPNLRPVIARGGGHVGFHGHP